MPRSPSTSKKSIHFAIRALWQYLQYCPPRTRYLIVALAIVGIVVWVLVSRPAPVIVANSKPDLTPTAGTGSTSVFFCFWNVENLFDDQDDKRRTVDEEFDDPFAKNAKLRQEKLDRLADIILKMNGGRGPDVLACAELESVRALDLLKGTLNRKLDESRADPKLKYTQVAMKNLDAGRHIAPGVLTRVPVQHAQTRQHGRMLRILETHILVNGHDLCLVASHWTSQLRQADGSDGDAGRAKYASTIYDVFADKAAQNPKVDFLVCGDFNATPTDDPLVNDLGVTGDRKRVTPRAEKPQLLGLMVGKDPMKFGTIWYNGKPLIYDQICVAPGLLDTEGWTCDVDSIQTYRDGLVRAGATRPEPWRFGDPENPPVGGRGYSDHFPITVQLTVAPPVPPKVKDKE